MFHLILLFLAALLNTASDHHLKHFEQNSQDLWCQGSFAPFAMLSGAVHQRQLLECVSSKSIQFFSVFLMQWQLLEPGSISGNLRATLSSGFFLPLILGLSRQTERGGNCIRSSLFSISDENRPTSILGLKWNFQIQLQFMSLINCVCRYASFHHK